MTIQSAQLTKQTAWGHKLVTDTILLVKRGTVQLSDYSTVTSDFRNATVDAPEGSQVVICSNGTQSLAFNFDLNQVVLIKDNTSFKTLLNQAVMDNLTAEMDAESVDKTWDYALECASYTPVDVIAGK